MGQNSCCSSQKNQNSDPIDQRLYDSNGALLDEGIGGVEDLLSIVNLDQYEHVRKKWVPESIQVETVNHEVSLEQVVTQVILTLNTNGIKQTIDLLNQDDTSTNVYNELIQEIGRRESKKSRHQVSPIKEIVSRNRLRYKDGDFNLDLSYITRRVIAMGYPGNGLFGLFRNHIDDVVTYFHKYHELKIKIYNMCNDKFVNVNQLSLQFKDAEVRFAYFPMMDHNPGPVPIIFRFALDVAMFLAADQKNIVAVHCKAGKGRSGLAICSYLILIEAVETADNAIKLFNSRRTSNGKGLGIASQIRYLTYFQQFLSQFKRPYLQIIAPFIHQPQIFDALLKSKNRLCLLSVCLGPFPSNPESMEITFKTRDFKSDNLFKNKSDPFEQVIIFDFTKQSYFILLVLKEQLTLTEDVCVMIKSQSAQLTPFDFRFWLNVNYIERSKPIKALNDINLNDFVQLTKDQLSVTPLTYQSDSFLKVLKHKAYPTPQSVTKMFRNKVKQFVQYEKKIFRSKIRTGQNLDSQIFDTNFINVEEIPKINIEIAQINDEEKQQIRLINDSKFDDSKSKLSQNDVKNLPDQLMITTCENDQLVLEQSLEQQQLQTDFKQAVPFKRRSSKFPQKQIRTKTQHQANDSLQSLVTIKENLESKQDIQLLMTKLTVGTQSRSKQDFFSDSEDEFCTLQDDTEEYNLQQKNPAGIWQLSPGNLQHSNWVGGSFVQRLSLIEQVKSINNFEIQKVTSSRKNIPRFGTFVPNNLEISQNDLIEISNIYQSEQFKQLSVKENSNESELTEGDETCIRTDQGLTHNIPESNLQQRAKRPTTIIQDEPVFLEAYRLQITNPRNNSHKVQTFKMTPSNELMPNDMAFFGRQTFLQSRQESRQASMVSSAHGSIKMPHFGIQHKNTVPDLTDLQEETWEQQEESSMISYKSKRNSSMINQIGGLVNQVEQQNSSSESDRKIDQIKPEPPLIEQQQEHPSQQKQQYDQFDIRNFLTAEAIQKFSTKQLPLKQTQFLHKVLLPMRQLDKFKNKKIYEQQGFKVQAVFVSDPYAKQFSKK